MKGMNLRISRINLPKHPTMWGIGCLGNISGSYVSFGRYMKGRDAKALQSDWQQIGADMRMALSIRRK